MMYDEEDAKSYSLEIKEHDCPFFIRHEDGPDEYGLETPLV